LFGAEEALGVLVELGLMGDRLERERALRAEADEGCALLGGDSGVVRVEEAKLVGEEPS